jgi:hypothetical protein
LYEKNHTDPDLKVGNGFTLVYQVDKSKPLLLDASFGVRLQDMELIAAETPVAMPLGRFLSNQRYSGSVPERRPVQRRAPQKLSYF